LPCTEVDFGGYMRNDLAGNKCNAAADAGGVGSVPIKVRAYVVQTLTQAKLKVLLGW
jgi:hypothetical protein